MAVYNGEDVYATLLLTDSYLPGALVLAHSLRDAGTTKKLVVLVTLDTVSADVITQLKAVFDYVIPVPRIQNEKPGNLFLMNRPDLHSAFTKINLWKQTQFRKIVYLDADVVAYRAPEELFSLPHAFSAAPDIGWPDLFNTGVMVLAPNMGDYYAMMAMAERGISFDGADQGLLNMHFKNTYNRISFTYNVTPSAHYQYLPAYKHYQSSINMVHFIGADKPWVHGRDKFTGDSPYDEMVGRWWAVYDRHYRREASVPGPHTKPPELVQYFVKGEYEPKSSYLVSVSERSRDQPTGLHGQQHQPPPAPVHFKQENPSRQLHPLDLELPQHQHQPHVQHDFTPSVHHQPSQHHHQYSYEQHNQPDGSQLGVPAHNPQHSTSSPSESFGFTYGTHTEAREAQTIDHQDWAPYTPPQSEHKSEPHKPVINESWDAQRHPPPPDSKPEAVNFPQTHYEMSSDIAPFVPPERYPSPPKNMWYEVPKERPSSYHQKPKAIFPWETTQPQPSRAFVQPPKIPASPEIAPQASPAHEQESQVAAVQTGPPWSSFPKTNAWDDMPGILRYVDKIQKTHRRTRSQGQPRAQGGPGRRGPDLRITSGFPASGVGSFKVTDFPSEDDRPSLPVTPAPIRRRNFWDGDDSQPQNFSDGSHGNGGGVAFPAGAGAVGQLLPAAEGVPAQTEWVCVHGVWWMPDDCLCDLTNVLRYHKDPVKQLQKLALKQQSEELLRRLSEGAAGEGAGEEIPSRPLPFGSENVISPTYVAPHPPNGGGGVSGVISPRPVRPGSGAGSAKAGVLSGSAEGESRSSSVIPPPSYQGPGAAFEKGEDYPTYETPALPTEDERDVLET